MRASCGGTFLPPRKRGSASATPATQRQRVANIGASSSAWISTVAHGGRMQIARDVGEREAVRGGERQHDGVLGRRRLQLEIELAAEALAQRQAPRAVDAAAERRVDDELHAAGLVEEALEHDRVLRRQAAERAHAPRRDSRRAARAAGASTPRSSDQPAQRALAARIAAQARRDLRAQPRHRDATARRCGRAPRRARTEWSAARPARPRRAPRRARRAGCGSDVLPSWKMSPARLSTAKSSLTRADDVALRLEQRPGSRRCRGSRRRR